MDSSMEVKRAFMNFPIIVDTWKYPSLIKSSNKHGFKVIPTLDVALQALWMVEKMFSLVSSKIYSDS